MSNEDIIQLKYNYDSEVDSLTLRVNEDYNYEVSLEVNPNLIIDVSTDKKVMAFEILGASDFFDNLTFIELQEANAEVTINVNEDVIKLEIQLKSQINNTPRVFTKTVKTINEDYVTTGIYNYKSVKE